MSSRVTFCQALPLPSLLGKLILTSSVLGLHQSVYYKLSNWPDSGYVSNLGQRRSKKRLGQLNVVLPSHGFCQYNLGL
jgi:hypothetical protein